MFEIVSKVKVSFALEDKNFNLYFIFLCIEFKTWKKYLNFGWYVKFFLKTQETQNAICIEYAI